MCVYPLMLPTSSLSISPPPPGVPAHMPAWTASVVTRVRTLPSLAGTRDCVCWSVCVHPSVTTEVGRVTDHPWPPWECGASADCFGYRRRVCSHACAYTRTYALVCSHQAPRLWIYIYKQSSCLTPNRWHHTPPPPLPYQCVLNQMGCQGHLWPPTALWLMGQPSPVTPPLYCTLTGIWHSFGPFIKNTATAHLSFLISLPISLIL